MANDQQQKTDGRMPASVPEAFLERAEQAPEKIALLFDGVGYSYRQLQERSLALAAALHGSGLQPGDRVGLFMDNSPDFVGAYLGTFLAGGVVVPINTQYRQVELEHILSDAGIRVCFTEPRLAPELARVRSGLPSLEAIIETGFLLEGFLAGHGEQRSIMPSGDAIAIIAYTSGTTGRSKGAMLLHRNLISNIQAVCSAWQWSATDHLLLTLPLFHVHGLLVGLNGTLVSGASVELRRHFDAAQVYNALRSEPITMFFGVPTMYTRLLAEAELRTEPPRPIRLYVSGSAPLSPQTFHTFEQVFGQPILERYGMTETGMNLTNPYNGEHRPGSIGMPFPGQEARVVDVRTREPVGPGTVGEIEVRGPHVFAGYWNQPAATAESFTTDGWFHTGDLGFVSDDGYFTITGRAKELIISGGYNIYPREVEEVLQGCPGVAEVAIVGHPDGDLGERVVAAVVRSDPSLTTEAVVAFCRSRLASYKKPREVFFVDALPRNALGKVQKHILSAQLDSGE